MIPIGLIDKLALAKALNHGHKFYWMPIQLLERGEHQIATCLDCNAWMKILSVGGELIITGPAVSLDCPALAKEMTNDT